MIGFKTPVNARSWFLSSAVVIGTLLTARVAAGAQTAPTAAAAPSPAPSAGASPAPGVSDPCTSLLAVVQRPSVTTSVCALKYGGIILENGYTNTLTTGPGGGVSESYPQSLLRVGTPLRDLELQLVLPTYERTTVGGPANGFSDAGVGLKYELGYTSKASYGINVIETEPTGDSAFTSGLATYTGNLNVSYTLSPEFGLASTLTFESLAAPQANGGAVRGGAFVSSLVLTAALPANAQLFGEAAYFTHPSIGAPGRVLYDFGLQKQLSPNVLADIEGGLAPAPVNGQRQHYIGGGISIGKL
jgi:hypothetical protein